MLTDELRQQIKESNLTKEDLKVIFLDNFINKYKDGSLYLNLIDLDFSDFNGDIYISGMKVKKNLYQSCQEVKGDLFQDNQEVKGDLFQDNQEVKGDLYQDNQQVQGNIRSSKSKIRKDK